MFHSPLFPLDIPSPKNKTCTSWALHKASVQLEQAALSLGIILLTITIFMIMVINAPAAHAKELAIDTLYIEVQKENPATLSNLIAPPEDRGLQGARQGVKDNNTTGKFLKHKYTLTDVIISHKDNAKAKIKEALVNHPHTYIVANMAADHLLYLADLPEAKNRLIFNAGSRRTDLRQTNCRVNVLHTIGSRKMLTDGLMQFLVKKRWTKIFLIEGNKRGDDLFANAIRASAKKFRSKIVVDKKWPTGSDIRRNAAQEVPAFTQGADYDVIIIADEVQDFGQYVQYHSWLPRPVAGSHGIITTEWDRVVEQWGAAQLQSRFFKLAKRDMWAKDYAAWAALRTISEAVTRLQTTDLAKTKPFILGPKIKLAMFKGRSMSYRPWSGQMRQSIPLINKGGAVVTLTPIEGFLHERTELDTIGIDEHEAKCRVVK